jgi:hypothetical protein
MNTSQEVYGYMSILKSVPWLVAENKFIAAFKFKLNFKTTTPI